VFLVVLRAVFVYGFDHRCRVFGRDVRGDAVAEVEDVAVAVAVVGKYAPYFVFDDVRAGTQDGGVKVALERDVFAEDAPRAGERGRPVQADGRRGKDSEGKENRKKEQK